MQVRLIFPKPGFFLSDAQLRVTFDGRAVYEGSFRQGFDALVDAEAGTHTVTTAVPLIAGLSRTKTLTVDLAEAPEGGDESRPVYDLELRYSRLWGNFQRHLQVTRLR